MFEAYMKGLYSKAALSWAKLIYYKYIVLAQLNVALL